MVFSSIPFLSLFLPVTVIAYAILYLCTLQLSSRLRHGVLNSWLLLASLVFYFWGEGWRVWILLAVAITGYVCGLVIAPAAGESNGIQEHLQAQRIARKTCLVIAVTACLALLVWFKYANLAVSTISAVAAQAGRSVGGDWMNIALPIGISFFTFQALSYLVDVYKGRVAPARNPIDFACYLTLFSQLIAGPILRYRDLAGQLTHRAMSRPQTVLGIKRFTLGLGKKVLIANTVAQTADAVFALPAAEMSTPLTWLAVVCYTLQIYFDFSGYSDMAIGLGHIFGFRFKENFNYPYIAQSMREFWTRWHISLSLWFRDYLYIPMGGNRISRARTAANLLTVFFLCGLWHGANWTFVIWGAFHGLFLVLERGPFGAALQRTPRPLRHLYALAVTMAGWVFFRCESLAEAGQVFSSLAGITNSGVVKRSVLEFAGADLALAVALGMLASAPVYPWVRAQLNRALPHRHSLISIASVVGVATIMLLCLARLSAGVYNPFIYFRF